MDLEKKSENLEPTLEGALNDLMDLKPNMSFAIRYLDDSIVEVTKIIAKVKDGDADDLELHGSKAMEELVSRISKLKESVAEYNKTENPHDVEGIDDDILRIYTLLDSIRTNM